MAEEPRTALLAATTACVSRYGIAKTTVEDVAREAGLSRATVYRHFPGGRDQLISECITWEVGRFFTRLGLHVDDAPDFPTRLEEGLLFAHQAVEEHELLQKVVETEPERLLPQLTVSGPLVVAVLRAYLEPLLEAERLCPDVTAEEAADWLARMILSFIVGQGSWDLGDRASVHRLVNEQLLAGILAPEPGSEGS
jgi:AcrR family transcriptional regulator